MLLPEGVVLRFVSWDGENIHDVSEFQTQADFRKYAKLHLGFTCTKRRLEVVSEDSRLTDFGADLMSGVPVKCKTTQPCLKVDGSHGATLVSLDRFWELLCESVAEVQASK